MRSIYPGHAALLALCISAGFTGLANAAPPVEHAQGDVRYVMGGIGLDESQEMKRMESQYSLSVTFAEQNNGKADYLADIPVTIRNASGQTVLSVNTDGPYLLVQLPPGSYEITASHGGTPKSSHFTVGAGTHGDKVVFDWR
jgi:hypothetical protein